MKTISARRTTLRTEHQFPENHGVISPVSGLFFTGVLGHVDGICQSAPILPLRLSLVSVTRGYSLNVFDGDLALQVVGERVLMYVERRQLQGHVILQLRREPLLDHVSTALPRQRSGQVRSQVTAPGPRPYSTAESEVRSGQVTGHRSWTTSVQHCRERGQVRSGHRSPLLDHVRTALPRARSGQVRSQVTAPGPRPYSTAESEVRSGQVMRSPLLDHVVQHCRERGQVRSGHEVAAPGPRPYSTAESEVRSGQVMRSPLLDHVRTALPRARSGQVRS